MMKTSRSVAIACLVLLATANAFVVSASDNDMKQGESLPTGVRITPTAARGSIFLPLNPQVPGHPDFVAGQAVTTATSPDGKILLVLTSGFNKQNGSSGRYDPALSNEYIFVFDISAQKPRKVQVLKIPNAFDGLAWNPNGMEFYVSGGPDDNVHVFRRGAASWSESGKSIPLGHGHAVGSKSVLPASAGLAVTADGTRMLVANFENDSVSMVDIANRTKVAEQDLRPGKINHDRRGVAGGEFPFWVTIKGNDKAYVSSQRDREIVVLDITRSPVVRNRIPVTGQPNKMILNRAQNLLFVALGSSDSVAVISTESDKVLKYIKATAPSSIFPNPKGWNGANSNSLALSPDERRLYVTNGGANSLAVLSLKIASAGTNVESEFEGLIPTGWYPNSVGTNRDGSMIYVVNGKSNTGPVPKNCRNTLSIKRGSTRDCNASNQYVWRLTKAGFLILPAPNADELQLLTKQVAINNHYVQAQRDDSLMAFLHGQIRHLIYVVKENRTYDQILGDLDRGNGDPKLVVFPRPITPNHHKLAQTFVTLDNFYDSGETSGDGWNWSTSATAADTVEKTEPINYADRGLSYDYEGANRNINTGLATVAKRKEADPYSPSDPDILPGTADISAPDSGDGEAGTGYLWNSALRAGLAVRNYGFFVDDSRYTRRASDRTAIPATLREPFLSKTVVAFAQKEALLAITDSYFRGFDNKFPDYWRFKEWEREFDGYVQGRNLPNLELVRFPHDHFGDFGSAIDGVNTPEAQMADNDYAVGLLVDKVSHSPYKDNTLIFVIEDDAQNGPDHVDAHRSTAFVVGPFVNQGAVISERYTTVNMIRTIVDVLGIEPLGINDAMAEPMSKVFRRERQAWSYTATVPDVLLTTQLPLKAPVAKSDHLQREDGYSTPTHDAAYWQDKTQEFDFSKEDRLDALRFNQVLWKGIRGENVPYPAARNGRDLRLKRQRILRKIRAVTVMERPPNHVHP